MTATTKTVTLGPFALGMDNRVRDHERSVQDGRQNAPLLRSAVNVDVSPQGNLRRRQGFTRSLAGEDCHSLYCLPAERCGYYVDFDTLFFVSGAAGALTKTALRSDMTPGRPVSYAQHPDGSVRFTNGVVSGRLRGAAALPACTPAPAEVPTVGVLGTGLLPPGRYQVCFALVAEDGEVGPASPTQSVVLPIQGGLTFGAVAVPPAHVLAVYVTGADGDVFARAAVTDGFDVDLVAVPHGPRCPTLLKAPMPAGEIIRICYGRILVASGNVLYYSDVYSSLTSPAGNYIQFPSAVTMVEPVQGGVFVADADRTYWLAGDIAQAELKAVLPYGAIPGASGAVPNTTAAWWMSARGVVIGKAGEVENLQEARIAVTPSASAAGAFIERDGAQQIVVPMFDPTPSKTAASSWMDAEVVRKGNPL